MIQERDAEIARLKQPPQPKPTKIEFAIGTDDADNSEQISRPTTAGFGTSFPINPQKGDLYLRVDMLPNKLFKWNGKKWIEVEKTTTDRYVYEEEYIKYIAAKVKSREYDFDDLSKPEQEEVLKYLDYETKSRL